jgi:hypothetical protein
MIDQPSQRQPVIAFDIEVAGYLWEEVDETTRGYLLSRARDEHDRAAVPERTGLYPGLGKIIAIGMWLVADDRGMILLEGAHHTERDFERVKDSKVYRGDEKQLLEKFWQLVGRNAQGRVPRLVSFNGRGYDAPMLMIRSAQHGVKPSRNLLPKRWEMRDHCDLMEVFNFQGATRESYGLEYWCRRCARLSPRSHRRHWRVLLARCACHIATVQARGADALAAVVG